MQENDLISHLRQMATDAAEAGDFMHVAVHAEDVDF